MYVPKEKKSKNPDLIYCPWDMCEEAEFKIKDG